MTVKIIAAVSLNGVIGNRDTNNLPWQNKYPEDMKFFRSQTLDSTIVFGRSTFRSFGSKPLPKRRNVLVSKTLSSVDGVEVFSSLDNVFKTVSGDVWLIGGSGIYQEGLKTAEHLYITSIPEVVQGNNLAYFPYVSPQQFKIFADIKLNEERGLVCNVYNRI